MAGKAEPDRNHIGRDSQNNPIHQTRLTQVRRTSREFQLVDLQFVEGEKQLDLTAWQTWANEFRLWLTGSDPTETTWQCCSPSSPFAAILEAVRLFVSAWSSLVVPVITAEFIQEESDAAKTFSALDLLFDVLFGGEILLRFCAGFYAQETDRKVEVREFRDVLRHRLTDKWLWLDLLTCAQVGFWYTLIRPGEGVPLWIGTYKFFIRVPYFKNFLFGSLSNQGTLSAYVSSMTYAGLFKMVTVVMYLIHLIACVWMLIKKREESASCDGVDTLSRSEFCTFTYLQALLDAFFLILGDPPMYALDSPLEAAFICVIALMGCVVIAYIFAQIAVELERQNVYNFQHHHRVALTTEAIKELALPRNVQHRVKLIQEWTRVHQKPEAYSVLLDSVSQILQRELRFYRYHELVLRCPFFAQLSACPVHDLLDSLVDIVLMPGDFVVHANTMADCMYFVIKGICEVCAFPGASALTVRYPGDYFGEAGILRANAKRTAFVRARVATIVSQLLNMSVEDMLVRYPEEREKLYAGVTEHLERNAWSQGIKTEEKTDLAKERAKLKNRRVNRWKILGQKKEQSNVARRPTISIVGATMLGGVVGQLSNAVAARRETLTVAASAMARRASAMFTRPQTFTAASATGSKSSAGSRMSVARPSMASLGVGLFGNTMQLSRGHSAISGVSRAGSTASDLVEGEQTSAPATSILSSIAASLRSNIVEEEEVEVPFRAPRTGTTDKRKQWSCDDVSSSESEEDEDDEAEEEDEEEEEVVETPSKEGVPSIPRIMHATTADSFARHDTVDTTTPLARNDTAQLQEEIAEMDLLDPDSSDDGPVDLEAAERVLATTTHQAPPPEADLEEAQEVVMGHRKSSIRFDDCDGVVPVSDSGDSPDAESVDISKFGAVRRIDSGNRVVQGVAELRRASQQLAAMAVSAASTVAAAVGGISKEAEEEMMMMDTELLQQDYLIGQELRKSMQDMRQSAPDDVADAVKRKRDDQIATLKMALAESLVSLETLISRVTALEATVEQTEVMAWDLVAMDVAEK